MSSTMLIWVGLSLSLVGRRQTSVNLKSKVPAQANQFHLEPATGMPVISLHSDLFACPTCKKRFEKQSGVRRHRSQPLSPCYSYRNLNILKNSNLNGLVNPLAGEDNNQLSQDSEQRNLLDIQADRCVIMWFVTSFF